MRSNDGVRRARVKLKRNKFESVTPCDETTPGGDMMTDVTTIMTTLTVATATATSTVVIVVPESLPLSSYSVSTSPLNSILENMDIFRLMVSFVGAKHYLFIALISQSFHVAYKQAFPKDTETKLNAHRRIC